jgi:hypothetical protein
MPMLIPVGYHGKLKNKIKVINFNAGHYQNNRPLASSLGGPLCWECPCHRALPYSLPPQIYQIYSSPHLFTYLPRSFCFVICTKHPQRFYYFNFCVMQIPSRLWEACNHAAAFVVTACFVSGSEFCQSSDISTYTNFGRESPITLLTLFPEAREYWFADGFLRLHRKLNCYQVLW